MEKHCFSDSLVVQTQTTHNDIFAYYGNYVHS